MKKYIDYSFAMASLNVALATSGDRQAKEHIKYARKVFDMLPWEECIPVSFLKKEMEDPEKAAVINQILADWAANEEDDSEEKNS